MPGIEGLKATYFIDKAEINRATAGCLTLKSNSTSSLHRPSSAREGSLLPLPRTKPVSLPTFLNVWSAEAPDLGVLHHTREMFVGGSPWPLLMQFASRESSDCYLASTNVMSNMRFEKGEGRVIFTDSIRSGSSRLALTYRIGHSI